MSTEGDIRAALAAVANLRAQLNEAATETIRRAWRHFQAHGSWPTFPQMETAIVRALPPRTNLVTSLHQTPKWAGWLGSPGHPSTITVMLLAVAAVVGAESAPVLRNFWRTFELARTKYLDSPDDKRAILSSDDLMVGLGMSQLEASQVFALLQSEALLGGGSTSGDGEQPKWAFQVADHIHDFRDAPSLAAYLEDRIADEIPGANRQTIGVGPRVRDPGTPPAKPATPKRPLAPRTGRRSKPTPKQRKSPARPARPPVPEDKATEVLYGADRTCCVCRKRRRSIQIHHLDGDRTNNAFDNLVALCVQCHDDTQVKGGFGRKLNRELIVRYRNEWYEIVKERRAGVAKQQPSGTKRAGRTQDRLDKEVIKYLDTLQASVDRITLVLNNAYQAGQKTDLPVSGFLTEFNRSEILLSAEFAKTCEDCYLDALRLTAALNNEPRNARAIHDWHERFMTTSRALRTAIIREARSRRGLS